MLVQYYIGLTADTLADENAGQGGSTVTWWMILDQKGDVARRVGLMKSQGDFWNSVFDLGTVIIG